MTRPKELTRLQTHFRWFKRRVCNRVTAGVIGAAFSLGFGPRVQLRSPSLRAKIKEVRYGSVLIWCSWRLDSRTRPYASSDEDKAVIKKKLRIVLGKRVMSIEARGPALDLTIRFAQGFVLHVFCDHVPGNPSFDGNWQVHVGDLTIADRPGGILNTSRSNEYVFSNNSLSAPKPYRPSRRRS